MVLFLQLYLIMVFIKNILLLVLFSYNLNLFSNENNQYDESDIIDYLKKINKVNFFNINENDIADCKLEETSNDYESFELNIALNVLKKINKTDINILDVLNIIDYKNSLGLRVIVSNENNILSYYYEWTFNDNLIYEIRKDETNTITLILFSFEINNTCIRDTMSFKPNNIN